MAVIPLRPGITVPSPRIETEVVGMIEEWLGMAKRGEIVAVGIAGVRPDNVVSTSFVKGTRHHHLVSGAVTLLRRVEE